MKYGFIGLGTMGSPMCLNLIKAGFELVVFDINKSVVNKLIEKGAKGADKISVIAEEAEVVFLSLPYGKIVGSVLEELLSVKNSKIKMIIDFSTISPRESKEFSQLAKKEKITYFDSPVSGAVTGAENGTLTMIVGCDKETLKKIQEPMNVMGNKIFFTGKVGNGSAVKLMNNYLVGINNIMVCEMMVLGKKLGIDLHMIFDIINNSSGRSFTTENLNDVFLDNRDFEKGFKIDLLYKDLKLAMKISKDIQFPLFIGVNAIEILEMARSYGYEKYNTYGVAKMFEDMSNIKINE